MSAAALKAVSLAFSSFVCRHYAQPRKNERYPSCFSKCMSYGYGMYEMIA